MAIDWTIAIVVARAIISLSIRSEFRRRGVINNTFVRFFFLSLFVGLNLRALRDFYYEDRKIEFIEISIKTKRWFLRYT